MKGAILAFALLLAVLLYGILKGVMSCHRAFAYRRWPTTLATFDTFEKTEEHSNLYGFDALYSYTVEGRQYQSSRLAERGRLRLSARHAVEFFGSLDPKQIQIRYNPLNPSEAIAYLYPLWVLIGGTAVLFLIAAGCVFGLRQLTKAP